MKVSSNFVAFSEYMNFSNQNYKFLFKHWLFIRNHKLKEWNAYEYWNCCGTSELSRNGEAFYNNGFFFRFLRAIVAWENGDDGKCSPQWNDLGHFAELNWCSPTRQSTIKSQQPWQLSQRQYDLGISSLYVWIKNDMDLQVKYIVHDCSFSCGN